jgi:hypothetical protein
MELPRELKEWILFFCDDDSLAISIPRISKLFNNIMDDNGAIWKTKCNLRKKNENNKLADQSWKRFYFSGKYSHRGQKRNHILSRLNETHLKKIIWMRFHCLREPQ